MTLAPETGRPCASGTCHGPAAGPRAFPRDAHRTFHGLRRGHFWFESRQVALREVLASLGVPANARALEVGCGDGYLVPIMPGRYRIGLDASLEDLREAGRRGLDAVVVGSGDRLPFRGGFGLVCAFDVIEHCADDVTVVRECASLLDAGGRLVLTAPAGPTLWSPLDEYAGHYRRYTRAGLHAVVERAGLVVERLFPLFRLLWPLAWANARIWRRRQVQDPASAYSVNPVANALLRRALAAEWRLARRCPIGRGTSWCVVARRG